MLDDRILSSLHSGLHMGPAYPDLVTDTIKSKFKSCIKREQNNLSEDK